MSTRVRVYQYTPLVGPVFVPAEVVPYDPANLEWIPKGQQPARNLAPNKLGDFVQPPFESLYKMEALQWIPSGRQPARGLAPNYLGDFQQPNFDALYKMAELQWLPSERQPARGLPPNKLGDFQQPPFESLYRMEGLQWIPSDRYAGRPLAYALNRWYVLEPTPPIDPALLTWQPSGQQPARDLPPNFLGDYFGPVFEALYKAEGLQWSPSERQPARGLLPGILIPAFLDPFPIPGAAYDPQTMEWVPSGRYPLFALPLNQLGWYVLDPIPPVDPRLMDWLATTPQPARQLQSGILNPIIIDPTGLIPAAFDPANFPYESFQVLAQRGQVAILGGVFVIDPTILLEPGTPEEVRVRRWFDYWQQRSFGKTFQWPD